MISRRMRTAMVTAAFVWHAIACEEGTGTLESRRQEGRGDTGATEDASGAGGSSSIAGNNAGGLAGAGAPGGGGGAAGSAVAGAADGGASGAGPCDIDGSSEDKGPPLCVFDYDLTLSSHACDETEDDPDLFCRVTECITYNWYEQCLSASARAAVAECIARDAYIGIASHASVSLCWEDKVVPIVAEEQFPELTGSPYYNNPDSPRPYPALDDHTNWNCLDCAYHMNGGQSKPEGIRRIMLHYGLDPEDPADQARVIFWDDEPGNIGAVQTELPCARAVLVPRNGAHGNHGGCGITPDAIAAGWEGW